MKMWGLIAIRGSQMASDLLSYVWVARNSSSLAIASKVQMNMEISEVLLCLEVPAGKLTSQQGV